MITGKTQLLGVVGHPIEHSLSPVMHNAAIVHLGVNYVYVPFPVKPADFEIAIAGFAAIGVQGFNLTIPHKQAILPLLSEVSEIAQAVGAVNTVWRTARGWSGTNTDVEGFITPLQTLQRNWQQTIALVLGSGGAARAVVAGLAQLGCSKIRVIGRNPEKLATFRQSWNGAPYGKLLSVYAWSELVDWLPTAGLVVNTTPIGMEPNWDQSPLTGSEMDLLPTDSIVYDLIYTPNPTMLLKQAQERRLITIDGLEMLVQQGAAALRIWLRCPVPIGIMRQSLRQYLGWL